MNKTFHLPFLFISHASSIIHFLPYAYKAPVLGVSVCPFRSAVPLSLLCYGPHKSLTSVNCLTVFSHPCVDLTMQRTALRVKVWGD